MEAKENKAPLLRVDHVACTLQTDRSSIRILEGIDFRLNQKTALGIVGESGAGKSMLIKAIMGITPDGIRVDGRIVFDGEDLLRLPRQVRSELLGRRVGMVFQNPMTSLNPFVRIGRQIEEAARAHLRLSRQEARARAIELLGVVGIADPEDCYDYFPHHFSGGMKQRIMIAAALACKPDLLIADEATTALDVTVQREVLDLLQALQRERQMSMMIVSHNLAIVAGRTDELLVLYGGHVVEYGRTDLVFRNPRHHYTAALLSAMPRMDQPARTKLATIPGSPPSLSSERQGCPFAPRCTAAQALCREEMPVMTESEENGHRFACHFPVGMTSSAEGAK